MGDLLSSLDVVNKAFKKTMRGYDPAEVDEFLDRVAESIQAYVQKNKDYERVAEEQGERLGDYENIKNSLHEALLMAQRTAEEKVTNAEKSALERINNANAQAEGILAEARLKAERMVQSAEAEVADFGRELTSLQELKEGGFASIRDFLREISTVLDNAENGARIQIPDMTLRLMKRAETATPPPQAVKEAYPTVVEESPFAPPIAADDAAKKQEISNTLNALGIDPSLLNVDA